MMLGGHSSFGDGGWADTPLADILPVQIHPGDGQLEPEGGLKFVPNTKGLNSYVLQVGANKTETARIWDMMPPILGTNRFGEVKLGANIIAETPGPNPEPLDGEHGGRRRSCHRLRRRHLGLVPLLGGEPARPSQVLAAGRLLALTQGERRRQPGQADSGASADRRGREDRPDGHRPRLQGSVDPERPLQAKVEREKAEPPVSKPVEIYNQGDEGKGAIYATERWVSPALTRSRSWPSVTARRSVTDKGRFLVYQDDRELENPSADRSLAQQIATITDGEAVSPERLTNYIKGLDRTSYSEYRQHVRIHRL